MCIRDRFSTAYIKALSACPLNWNDKPNLERSVIAAAVDCCYFPLYEIERGITVLNYDPASSNKKIPVTEWLGMMGRTRHLLKEEYRSVTEEIQKEIDRRYDRLKAVSYTHLDVYKRQACNIPQPAPRKYCALPGSSPTTTEST